MCLFFNRSSVDFTTQMSSETFEFSRARWNTETVNYPAVVCPQPQGHVISFIFQSGWGGTSLEIQGIDIQGQDGKITDTLISDKWYLNPDLFPDSISFSLVDQERPAFILFENGVAQNGIKEMSVMYDDEQIWCGEVPMGTSEQAKFPIAVPIQVPEFHRPDIKTFRQMKTIEFEM